VAIYTGLALFAGGGGLELGLSLALGTDYKTVAYVERECTSAAVLAANMERGWLDKAPIWDDVTTFTGDAVSPLVDNIDIISAGFPCQPWSVAGSRKGTDDERWLWPLIFRLVREIRPRSIFLENVPGLLHGGIEHVLGDLASVGFDAEWTSVRASDVGAPHRRERVFILATAIISDRRGAAPERSERGSSDLQSAARTRRLQQLGNAQSIVSERAAARRNGTRAIEAPIGKSMLGSEAKNWGTPEHRQRTAAARRNGTRAIRRAGWKQERKRG
jgi:site-specific DNA-cytosine methylase